jgi:hypothetical protein
VYALICYLENVRAERDGLRRELAERPSPDAVAAAKRLTAEGGYPGPGIKGAWDDAVTVARDVLGRASET